MKKRARGSVADRVARILREIAPEAEVVRTQYNSGLRVVGLTEEQCAELGWRTLDLSWTFFPARSFAICSVSP